MIRTLATDCVDISCASMRWCHVAARSVERYEGKPELSAIPRRTATEPRIEPESNQESSRDMPELSERLNTPISTAELERRWKAVRAAMERDRIDVLVMQNNNDHMGGYVKYFTDMPAGYGYPVTVVFPRDDLMTVVMQGPFGGAEELSAAGDGVRRGVKRVLTTPSYASAYYTAAYDPELAASALEPFAQGK